MALLLALLLALLWTLVYRVFELAGFGAEEKILQESNLQKCPHKPSEHCFGLLSASSGRPQLLQIPEPAALRLDSSS